MGAKKHNFLFFAVISTVTFYEKRGISMTEKHIEKAKGHRPNSKEPTSAALGILGIFSLLLLFKNPSVALEHTSSALSLCARTVVPSLFPFMVISELLLSSDAVSVISRPLRHLSRILFGVGGESAAALILGFLCGFPIGAKCAASLYAREKIGGEEMTRILTFCCMPSAPFLISAVGISMFGDLSLGLRLFIASLLSSLIIGIIGRFIPIRSLPPAAPTESKKEEKRSSAAVFTSAVTSSALSMLYVCAFVVFFSTLVGVLEYTAAALSLPKSANALLFGFFELTSGIKKTAEIPVYGKYLAAAISGWSGLSVHFQVISVCRGCNLSFKPYFFAKAASTALTPIILFFLMWIG